jgi:hypothetical protein
MLFTILIGIIGAAIYSLRMAFVKLRFVISGGKKVEMNQNKIPFVIFSDNKRYWNIFEPICRELDQRGVNVVYMTASPDDPALSCGLEHIKGQFIGEGNKAFAKLNFLNAGVVLSTTPGLDVYQWKRSKEVNYYVHIPHAANDITLYRMFGIDHYDAVLLPGQFHADQIREMEKLRDLPAKELVTVGIPYMDEMKKRLDQAGPLADHPTTILLAPSWGPEAILTKYGEKIIQPLLDTGFHVIIRPHPQSFESEKDLMDKLMKKYPESDQLEWNRDRDNFEVLRRSDLMISDFSGVIFDFTLIYDKPVIYTDAKINTDVYDAWWLKSPLWTTEILPKIGHKLEEENIGSLKELVEECMHDTKYAEGREEARKEAWANPGEGAVKTADYLIAKEKEIVSKEEEK